MTQHAMTLALSGLAGAGVLLAVTLALTTYFRLHRRRLLRRQSAAELRRSAEHIHLVAQACHRHTGNAEIGRVLQQLAEHRLEEAAARDHRDETVRKLLDEYRATDIGKEANRLEAHASGDDEEAVLSRIRLLLTEGLRLLRQLEREGVAAGQPLQQMRDNVQQACRALDLRLRLRRAAQTESLTRQHVYQEQKV